ncbi:hypothetical protein [Rhizorhabdus sp.]|uniref:hypothetical protein n=1 Tax=Rhizorhabdus sp. TaxID=1968843 RepID=UPI0035AF194D
MSRDEMIRFRCVMLRRSGSSDIRVVRAPDAATARAILEARGLEPVSVEAIGPSLLDAVAQKLRGGWRLPVPQVGGASEHSWPELAWRTALLIAAIPVLTAGLAWSWTGVDRLRIAWIERREGTLLTAQARLATVERTRHGVDRVAGVPPLSTIAAQLAATLPEDAGIESLSLTPDGELLIEIVTPDPDSLRAALAENPLLASLGERSQSRTDAGTIRVGLEGRLR